MDDVKMLFARGDMCTSSFTAVDGSPLAFQFEDHFLWEGRLGTGSFADVYAVRHKQRTEERYAIKAFKGQFKSRAERTERLREAELANQIPAHENVIEYYRVWQQDRLIYVQMELAEGGTLSEQMKKIAFHTPTADPLVWTLIRQVAAGLAHIHRHSMLHCE